MDGFTMYFLKELNAPEVAAALQDQGFGAACDAGGSKVDVSRQNAHVWVYVTRKGDLTAPDLEEREDWPVSLEQLGTLATVMVRRNDESITLAVEVAQALVLKFRGMITWDGMDYWENQYRAYVSGLPGMPS